MKLKNSVYILLLLLIPAYAFSQKWIVPEIQKKKVAPFKFTTETQKIGEKLFSSNCQSCHGTPGKNNFSNITPPPGDPATDKFQLQLDGELFYKISNGRKPMPTFKSILSVDDRWNIISFFRSFNKSYIQPDPTIKQNDNEYFISFQVNQLPDSNKLKVIATATSVKDTIPVVVSGADITLFAKRTFGFLQIGTKKTTNKNGEAVFAFPSDLPGDTAGYVNLTIKLMDEIGSFGEGETNLKLKMGKATHPKSLIETRAMWTVRSQAPVWLIAAYCSCVLTVIGFVLYILMQINKLRKIGSHSAKEND